MPAVPKPLYVEQGATFFLGFNWHRQAVDEAGNPILDAEGNPVPGAPYDLAGCTARMQIRKRLGDPVLVTATSASSGEGAERIKLEPDRIDEPTGRIEITLTDEDTNKLDLKAAVYDLEIEWLAKAGELRPHVDRLLQGSVTVDLNVTREEVAT